MFKLPSSLLSAALAVTAQNSPSAGQPPVSVPTFANSTCPIMGKKVSMSLFTDTDFGRIYVCCKPCIKKILLNLPAAQNTAYPATKSIANATCPVTGKAIGNVRHSLTLQGVQFDLCCAECVGTARSNSQIVLAKIDAPKLRDLGNLTCPITGQPTADNAFVVVGDAIVRLASPNHVADVQKDARAALAKAIEIASRQAKPVHVPRKSAGDDRNPGQPEAGK